VEGSAPSKTKEETTDRLRAGDVGALATLGSLPAPTERRIFIVCILLCVDVEKKVDGSTSGQTGTICRNRLGRAALMREQEDQLESNRCENGATEEKSETNHRHRKHSPWKRRNGGMPAVYSGNACNIHSRNNRRTAFSVVYAMAIAMQLRGRHICAAANPDTTEELCFLHGPR
jgi:hypothetical protein